MQDRNEIFVILEWDTLDNAKKFGQSEELHRKQEQSGVIGQPEVFILEEVEKLQV